MQMETEKKKKKVITGNRKLAQEPLCRFTGISGSYVPYFSAIIHGCLHQAIVLSMLAVEKYFWKIFLRIANLGDNQILSEAWIVRHCTAGRR